MRYYLIIGKPHPFLKAGIPIWESEGLFKCLGVIEKNNIRIKDLPELPPEFVIINLDIIMQEANKVMKALEHLLETTPTYIGITDSAIYGLNAFKLGFKDVLLTPRDSDEIKNTLLKNSNFRTPPTDLICFNSFRDVFYLRPTEIIYLKADDFTTDVYLTDGRVIGILRTIKTFGKILPPQFLRIQRSIIINTCYLYHVNNAKKRCSILGVPTDFKYSKIYIPNKLLLQRWI